MAKLSALVIPAVIDTSGVDKGISQIKNKLSKVRGGGGGIGGSGPGFSSGVTPYGGHLSDVGSGTSAAMAAAFGAAAANRLGGNAFERGRKNVWQGIPKGGTNWAQRHFLTRRTTQAYYSMRVANADFKEDPSNWETLDSAQQGQARYFQTLQRQKDLRRAVGRGMLKRKASAFMDIGSIGGNLPRGLLPLGLGTAAYNFFDPKNQKSRFANTAEFAGTENYQAMVALRRQAFQPENQFMSLFQSIDVGAQKARGKHGGQTNLRNLGSMLGGGVQGFGEVLGTASEGPIAMAGKLMGGGNDIAAQAYTEGMEAVVGGMILSVENAFKRLFS